MKKMKLAILFGGNSPEYPVSLQSAYAIIKALDEKRYEKILIGITKDGSWYRYYGDIEHIKNDTWSYNSNNCIPVSIFPDPKIRGIIELKSDGYEITAIDAAFPVMHGRFGEDGTVQGLIELAGVPLIGCDTLSSALCMDKYRAHKLVAQAGIKTPKSVMLTDPSQLNNYKKHIKNLKYPLFVKPVRAGSSFGITKVVNEEELVPAINMAFSYDSQIIVEENIDGFEVGCAILGNKDLIIGEVDEIELSEGFFDYIEKYTLKSSRIHMPARIDTDLANRIKMTAARIYKTLGCKGFARVDMFLTPDKKIVFNEVNTIPGFTANSRFPNMMKGIGLSYSDILDILIDLGTKNE